MQTSILVVCPDGRFVANLDACVAKSRYLEAMFRPDSDGNPRTREAVERVIETRTRYEVVRTLFAYMTSEILAIRPDLIPDLYQEADVYMISDLIEILKWTMAAKPELFQEATA